MLHRKKSLHQNINLTTSVTKKELQIDVADYVI